jgi:hypothetical protein
LATVTDILLTILQLRGASEYAAGMGKASEAVRKVEGQEKKLTDTQKKRSKEGGLGSLAGGAVSGGIHEILAELAALKLLHDTITTFAADEKIMRNFALTMRNMGRGSDVAGLVSLAQGLSALTGVDDEAIVHLEQTLANFGVSTKDIARSIEPILNIAEASGQSADQVAETLGRATQGMTRGLRGFGINLREGMRGTEALNAALKIANERFGDLARTNLNSTAGRLQQLATTWGNMLSAMGRFFSPVINGLIHFLEQSIHGWELLFDRLSEVTGRAKPGDPNTLPGGKALKGDPQQTGLLGEIADNTAKTADNFVKNVLGGKGDIARRAGSWRDAGIALGT